MGKGINRYMSWKWHSAAAQGSLLQGSKFLCGLCVAAVRGKGLILVSAVRMGSYVLIHLVKLSHEHHFLQHLGFPLELWCC